MVQVEKQEVFDFLERLKESSVTNMIGATLHIREEFGITSTEAREFLYEWITTYGEDKEDDQ